jgi:methylenetetrahydrofolate--tRNA-(uracil-5-)-methyltransferase
MTAPEVTVIGGGMAGSEAAWQLACAGLRVRLVEMKPAVLSPAHESALLGELVCSNSLRSNDEATPAGLLKRELRGAGSMVIDCADANRVPAGAALAVERFGFARAITARLAMHPNITIERRCARELPDGPVIVATGPLTAGALGDVIRRELGGDRMYFYDAIAPIVAADSIDWDHAFTGSRWGKESGVTTTGEAAGPRPGGGGALYGGDLDVAPEEARARQLRRRALAAEAAASASASEGEEEPASDPSDPDSRPATGPVPDEAAHGDVGVGDYINCPLNKAEYFALVDAVVAGRKVLPHEFEQPKYFEGCMPIEVMAERGRQTLRFGPMRPIGLRDPRTGHRPWAVVQLRPENRYLTAYNLVGFQTRLAYPEQQRIFAMIPALRTAEFLRFGSIHRNTYIDAPAKLGPRFELRDRPSIRFAGLLTGVEGYIESCAMGLLCARALISELTGQPYAPPPASSMMGALYLHVCAPREGKYRYTPTNANFGLLPPLGDTRKDQKKIRMAARACADFDAWLAAGMTAPIAAPSELASDSLAAPAPDSLAAPGGATDSESAL